MIKVMTENESQECGEWRYHTNNVMETDRQIDRQQTNEQTDRHHDDDNTPLTRKDEG